MALFYHAPPYSLYGQSGKTLPAALVTMEAYGVDSESAFLTLRSQDTDTLQWFHRGATAPDWMQEVSLYNTSGSRIFTGNVTAADPEFDGTDLIGWNVTVSGPWWWIEQCQLTAVTIADNGSTYVAPPALQTQVYQPVIRCETPGWCTITCHQVVTLRYTTDGSTPTSSSTQYSGPFAVADGTTVKARGFYSGWTSSTTATATFRARATFGCPAQDLATSITALMARMQALGVPLRIGTIDTTFLFQQMSFQGSSAAAALRDMLDAIPDCMTSVRYDVSGLPYLDIRRRGVAISTEGFHTTLALGTDTDLTQSITLKKRKELRPSYVTVQSLSITPVTGELALTETTAGDGAGATGVLGKQYISVAGPGTKGYKSVTDAIDKVTLVTSPISSANLLNLLYLFDPRLNALWRKTGKLDWALMTSATIIKTWTGTTYQLDTYGTYEQWQKDGTVVAVPTGWHAVRSGNIPDWWDEVPQYRAKVKVVKRLQGGSLRSYAYYTDLMNICDFWVGTADGAFFYYDATVEMECVWLDCQTPTTIVRPRDQYLVTPVANLAGNLFAAQAFIPYDGSVPLCPGSNPPTPGNVLNITGGLAEWATMNAMVSATSINLTDGSAQLTIGAAPRTNANALLDRFGRATSGRIINI